MGEQADNTKQPAEPKERTRGNAQKNSYTLLLVLPPTSLDRFRPQSSKIYRRIERAYQMSNLQTAFLCGLVQGKREILAVLASRIYKNDAQQSALGEVSPDPE